MSKRAKKKTTPAGAIDRLAILHADGSATVLAEDVDMEGAEEARRRLDANVRKLADLSIIADVQIVVLKEYPSVATPAAPACPCPHCRGHK